MKLLLTNGYPFPYPVDMSDAQQEEISEAAPSRTLEVSGVVAFEWTHTVTVQICESFEAWQTAKKITRWDVWSEDERLLEARVSAADGYDHPAIVVGDTAYCGFQLVAD